MCVPELVHILNENISQQKYPIYSVNDFKYQQKKIIGKICLINCVAIIKQAREENISVNIS